jgi:hypothetical protein
MTIDSAGNVYVTGTGSGSTQVSGGFLTIKYDTNGNKLWERNYTAIGAPHAIFVDQNGNVYVTGTTGSDFATVKYDPDGNQLWSIGSTGSASGYWNEAYALTVDVAGNVYVTGQIGESYLAYDYLTIKYDSDGTEVWRDRYNGPGNGTDSGHDISVDSGGNVYVTGSSDGASGTGMATIKYDTNGTRVWVRRYEGPQGIFLDRDSTGNIYVAAGSTIIKYSSAGSQLWVRSLPFSQVGIFGAPYSRKGMAVDSTGSVYLTGTSFSGAPNPDYITIKYDLNGNLQWTIRYNGPANSNDYGNAIAVDSPGNVYVTGATTSAVPNNDATTIKYSQQLPLSVALAGSGGGTVTSNPSGINCGATCSASFPTGTTVTLTATPDGTSTFAGWSGACTGTGSCMVSMSDARTVTATFTRIQYALNVTKTGSGSGTVTSSPAGLNCGTTCAAAFNAGTVVTLTATPSGAFSFAEWSGACSGTGSCVVTMDMAKVVTATFTADSDGDGFTNFEESIGGSDPGNSSSIPTYAEALDNLGRTVRLVVPADGTISDFHWVDPTTLPSPPAGTFPYGLVAMMMGVPSPGATRTVAVTFPGSVSPSAQYEKYGPIASPSWYTFPFGSNDGDVTITLTLTDGGAGDHDGAANGVIADPGGPFVAAATETLGNISTRAQVGTGTNRAIGGFILQGSGTKQVLIRARGPSMSGAPDFLLGTLANPYVRIYSVTAGAYIAQNDDWGTQSDPLCASSGNVCGTPAEITATGLDPCVPNPGQSVAPPGCANEAVLLITLPPGGYTAVVSGVSNGTGVGLVEVFDVGGSSTAQLVNISTRAQVGILANRMIGGFILEGSSSKQMLIRARGPSMGGAPDFVPGTLSNPYVRIYSVTAGAYIAQNDNWGDQSDPLCAASGYVCGTGAEITATGLDPCVPNPGQSVAPPGCANESVLLITLPPGAYTAVMSGVNNGTGVGLVEVFDVAP